MSQAAILEARHWAAHTAPGGRVTAGELTGLERPPAPEVGCVACGADLDERGAARAASRAGTVHIRTQKRAEPDFAEVRALKKAPHAGA